MKREVVQNKYLASPAFALGTSHPSYLLLSLVEIKQHHFN
jgi:hypothetical protein